MSEIENTTCIDYLMEQNIRGMEELITRQYYIERGASPELVDNAIAEALKLEATEKMLYERSMA